MPTIDDIAAHLLDQDVVWVFGGSVAGLLAMWHRYHTINHALLACAQGISYCGAMTDCLLCTRVAMPTSPPGGWIHRDDHWAVSGHPGLAVPGWLAMQTCRHAATLADLQETESLTLGPLVRNVSRWLREATGADRTYLYALGESIEHVHILIGVPLSETAPEGRGGALLSRILHRDSTLVHDTNYIDSIANVARVAQREQKYSTSSLK